MKFTLSWLKDHLETDASVADVAEKLTALGLEVEKVTDSAADLADFTVARVIEAVQHPNADRLRLCRLETKFGEMQVVCGAPNARTGLRGVFAPSGVTIPATGMVLKPSKIRGVESNGMLCSERELGLSDDHGSIIELPEDAPVGAPFAAVMGLDDPMIEIAITPNRADALAVHGVARDLAAGGLGRFKRKPIEPVEGTFQSPIGIRLDLPEAVRDACPLFAGRLIRGVKNGPSPAWLQQRLKAIGLRPISALVDVTNYLSYDRAQPLHVYDADKLEGGIVVRPGKPGETLLALDGRTYDLDADMCVIADEKRALGLGGVMGGVPSGSTEETVNVFVEAALFDPKRTARTGRRLGIDSDARYRFERGVDPEATLPVLELATRMILDMCGGEPSEVAVAGATPDYGRIVELRPDRVKSLGGVDLKPVQSIAILESLGFKVEEFDTVLQATPPSWRGDIDGEADLIEEILRIHGYDKIPSTPLDHEREMRAPSVTPSERRVRQSRRVLAARGLSEAVTWAFLKREDARLFDGGDERLALENPISADLDQMRPSLLPNLVRAAARNADRGIPNVGLFEVGAVFAGDGPKDQSLIAAGVRRGMSGERHWRDRARPLDAFDAKADALELLRALGAPADRLQTVPEAPSWYHPGRSGAVKLGPKNVLAQFGELHPGVLASLGVKGAVFGFEVFLDAIPLPKLKATRTRPPLTASDLPAVERDFAFMVDRDVPAETVIAAALGADKVFVRGVGLFDVYEGERVESGKKSVAIAVRIEPKDATLTDAEIDAIGDKIVAAVQKATGGSLRA